MRADDEIRTRDPNLGKVVLYQLSHIRASCFQDLATLTEIFALGKLQTREISRAKTILDLPLSKRFLRAKRDQPRRFHRCWSL